MNRKTGWGLAACLLLPLAAGCNAGPNVVRGQSPSPGMSIGNVPAMPVSLEADGYPSDPGPVYYAGHPTPGPDVLVEGYAYDGFCNHAYGHGGCGYGLYPQHRTSYVLKGTKNLAYPPPNQPPAVVTYPYYTVKGPTDFFLQ